MNFISVFMMVFSVIAAIDLIFGDKLGLGSEFKKGFMLFGNMALSMIGMIILAPALGELIKPVCEWMYATLHIDPSIVPAMLLANDMGGASLAAVISKSADVGMYNALVVSSMMGCTVSFTIPFALSTVKKEQYNDVLFGFLCGIVTIPMGCFVSGLVCGIGVGKLLLNLLPMIVFSLLVALGLSYFPITCVKIFKVLGKLLQTVITTGLVLGVIKFLTGVEIVKGLATIEEGALICLNASCVMSGVFPFLCIVSKLIKKPLDILGKRLDINNASAFGMFSSLATSMTTFKNMEQMDKKGVVLNSAFAVSAAFTFADHLAFTMAFESDYIFSMIIGKLTAGVLAVLLAAITYNNGKRRI